MITHKNLSNNSDLNQAFLYGIFTFVMAKGIEVSFTANDLKSFNSPLLNDSINFTEWENIVRNNARANVSNNIKYALRKTLVDSYDEYFYSDITCHYSSLTDDDAQEETIVSISNTMLNKYTDMLEQIKTDNRIFKPFALANVGNDKSTWVASDNGLIQQQESFALTITNEKKEEIFTYIAEYFKNNFEAVKAEHELFFIRQGEMYTVDFLSTDGLNMIKSFTHDEPSAEKLKQVIKFFIKDAKFVDFFDTENYALTS